MTLRYKLRTLLILLAVLPPLLWLGWTEYQAWRVELERRADEVAVRAAFKKAMRDAAAILNAPPDEGSPTWPDADGNY